MQHLSAVIAPKDNLMCIPAKFLWQSCSGCSHCHDGKPGMEQGVGFQCLAAPKAYTHLYCLIPVGNALYM